MKSLLFFLVLISCGIEDDSLSSSDAATISMIDGTWESHCFIAGFTSVKATLIFNAGKSTLNLKYYDNQICVATSLELKWLSSFSVSGERIDFTFEKVIAIISQEASIDDANKNNLYGYNDWKINEEKDVAGKKLSETDDPEPNNGDQSTRVFKITDNKTLYLSNKNSDQLNTDIRYQKLFSLQ